MARCIFCGEEREELMTNHHLIPKFILDRVGPGNLSEYERNARLSLCIRCHTVLHNIIFPPIDSALKKLKA